jgi:hypothetical protein
MVYGPPYPFGIPPGPTNGSRPDEEMLLDAFHSTGANTATESSSCLRARRLARSHLFRLWLALHGRVHTRPTRSRTSATPSCRSCRSC